jgi:hypothetical protein
MNDKEVMGKKGFGKEKIEREVREDDDENDEKRKRKVEESIGKE